MHKNLNMPTNKSIDCIFKCNINNYRNNDIKCLTASFFIIQERQGKFRKKDELMICYSLC